MKRTNLIIILVTILLLFASCKATIINTKDKTVTYELPTLETTTSSYEILDNNKVKVGTVNFEMPKDYVLVSEEDFIIENEDSSISISVEDKTSEILNFDNYIQQTIATLKSMGVVPSAPISTKINEYNAQRIDFDMLEIDNSNSKYYSYYIDLNDTKEYSYGYC